MPLLLSIPILALALMLQTVVVSSLPLLNGFADLILLVLVAWALQDRVRLAWVWALVAGGMVGFVSAMPSWAPLVGYLSVVILTRLLRRRIWQSPIFSMFFMVFLGSLITLGLDLVVLIVAGAPLSMVDSLNLVVLPSTLLNLILALPVYAIITDLAQWMYPEEVEI